MKIIFVAVLLLLSIPLAAQNYSFVKKLASTQNDHVNKVIQGDSGRIFIGGYFSSNFSYDNKYSLSHLSGQDAYVLCVDGKSGKVFWALSGGYYNNDQVTGICEDGVGNIFITGNYVSRFDMDGKSVTSGGSNFFVAKINKAGKLCWLQSSQAPQFSEMRAQSISYSKGNIQLAGYFKGTGVIGSHSYQVPGSTWDMFLCNLDSSGNFKRSMYNGAGSKAEKLNVIHPYSDGWLIGGNFTDSLVWNGLHKDTLGTFGFLMKIDSNWNTEWFQLLDVGSSSEVIDISNDDSTNIYYCGRGGSKAIATKLDSLGKTIWKHTTQGSSVYNAIRVDKNFHVLVTGGFKSGSTIDGKTIPTACTCANNGYDYYIVELDENGAVYWFNSGGGASFDDFGYGLTIDNRGNLLIGGDYMSNASIGFTNLSAFSGQQSESFFARIDREAFYFRKTDSKLCANEGRIEIEMIIRHPFDSINQFNFYLSDSAGSFINPLLIESLALFQIQEDSVFIQLPNPLKVSEYYSIMAISSHPIDTFYISGGMQTLVYPIADFSVNDSIQCFNGHTFLLKNTSIDPTLNANIMWDYGDGNKANTKFPVTKSFTNPGSNSCTMYITMYNTCFDSITKVLRVKPNPVAGLTGDIQGDYCRFSPLDWLDSSSTNYFGGVRYDWYLNGNFWDTGKQVLARVSDTGQAILMLVIVDSMSCTDTALSTINILAGPEIDSIQLDLHLCIGDSTSLKLFPPNLDIYWFQNDTLLGSENSINVGESGNYYAVVSNSFGCQDTSEILPLTFFNKPTKPVIYLIGESLHSTIAYNFYQWYNYSGPMEGETDSIFKLNENGFYRLRVQNDSFCHAWSDSLEVISLGFEQIKKTFQIYPNPGSQVLNIDFGIIGNYSVKISNSEGKVIIPVIYTSEEKVQIQVNNLAAGLYIIEVTDANLTQRLKYVKY